MHRFESRFSNRSAVLAHALEWLPYVVAIVLIGIVAEKTVPFEPRTFSLIDSTIAQPTHQSIITYEALVATIITIPLGLYGLAAYRQHYYQSKHASTTRANLIQSYLWISAHFKTLIVTVTLTELMKLLAQEYRPDWIYRCFGGPAPASVIAAAAPLYLVTPDICTQSGAEFIDGHKSFPSGHTSTAFSSCIFLSIFIWRVYVRQHVVRNYFSTSSLDASSTVITVHEEAADSVATSESRNTFNHANEISSVCCFFLLLFLISSHLLFSIPNRQSGIGAFFSCFCQLALLCSSAAVECMTIITT